jgi:hypothetical protein
VKISIVRIPENPSLTFFSSVTPFAFTSHHLHYRYHPTIAEFDPMDSNPAQFICYNASSSVASGHIHDNLLESSNIRDLESWALTTLPLC